MILRISLVFVCDDLELTKIAKKNGGLFNDPKVLMETQITNFGWLLMLLITQNDGNHSF